MQFSIEMTISVMNRIAVWRSIIFEYYDHIYYNISCFGVQKQDIEARLNAHDDSGHADADADADDTVMVLYR